MDDKTKRKISLKNRGEGLATKLTEKDVLDIRARCDAGESRVQIAKDYGIHPSYVSNLHARRRWTYLS